MLKNKEGFEVSSPKLCSPQTIRSFPLKLAITATETLYDSVSEPITMDIQWGSRSTPPAFIAPVINGVTDEVSAGNTNLTSLRFGNNSYKVVSVQIIGSSHNHWILPQTSQANNTEDIIVTFFTESTTTQYTYIAFVIPIIRSSIPSNAPAYLSGLEDRSLNGPFSLKECFPMNPRARFAYYATCLAGYSGSANTQSMYVFVSTDGLQVVSTLMAQILKQTGRPQFGTYIPPFTGRLTSNATIVKTIGNFTNYVMTTTQLLNYNRFKELYPTIETNVREDNTNAYQCVAIDPDDAIVDGKLKVNLESGEVLTNVIASRDALRASVGGSDSVHPGRIEKYMGSALGVILSIILFCSILYFAITLFSEQKVSTGVSSDPSWTQQIPAYGFLALTAGFIGFIVGAMIS